MKSFWAFFFVSLYVLAMARPVLPLFDYVVNQDYIAEFLCVNKDKAELQCNGKCYLMQKLQAESDEKHENLPRIAMEEYPIGFVELLSFSFTISTKKQLTNFDKYQNSYHYLYSYSSYHPPTLLG